MSLSIQTLPLTLQERRKAERINTLLKRLPRIRTDGWLLATGQSINPTLGHVAGTVSASVLRSKGLNVSHATAHGPKGDTPLRLLEPDGPSRGLVLDFHGGGWVVGGAALNDHVNTHLVVAGFTVASVEYRLLNQARNIWLADAVADCVCALTWGLSHGVDRSGGPGPIIIGESAGAHLAALALTALPPHLRQRFLGCVFVQGVFDLTGTPSVLAADADTLLFNGPQLANDLGRLTPGMDADERRKPQVSPLYADLASVPPALFIMGEQDPLRDDSRLMAEAWSRQAETVRLDIPTAPHGFQHFGAPTARQAQAAIRAWLDRRLSALSVENPTA